MTLAGFILSFTAPTHEICEFLGGFFLEKPHLAEKRFQKHFVTLKSLIRRININI